MDFLLSGQAERFCRSGVPLLYQDPPSWRANLVERLRLPVLPIVSVVVPTMKIVPPYPT